MNAFNLGHEGKIAARVSISLGMDGTNEVEFAVDTLTKVLRHEHRRLAHGAALRDYVHRQIALGNEPDHYRVEWIRTSVIAVLETLEHAGEAFNQAHPNDKVSVLDLMDVIESTRITLANRTQNN